MNMPTKGSKIPTIIFLLGWLLLFFNGCAKAPLDKLTTTSLPHFADDLKLSGLLTGAVRQLHYLNTLPEDTTFTYGPDTFPVSWMRESMKSFIDILRQDPDSDELGRIIAENFSVYQAGGRDQLPRGEMLITGYYEPFLKGSLLKKAPYLYPLYGPPDSLLKIRDPKSGHLLFKRRDEQGHYVPYWTRQEIEEQGIATGKELVYLDSPVDAFILQVQGSGKIQLRDGSIRSLHYAASNGLEYFSIGRLLVEQGKLSLAKASLPAIRQYLSEHPAEQNDILNHNIKFIFFNWAPGGPPVGSIGEPLVAGRSIAIDPEVLPQTSVAFLISRRPVLGQNGEIQGWRPLHRFVFPQDTGGAIKGPGRADLYWGGGAYAKAAAGEMKEPGRLFFLVKNSFEDQGK